ncbi:MAG: MarR family transcriptional regulator [Halobaculum sp.]
MSDDSDRVDVLRNKRDATRYRILVQIAQRQPAVSQQEIADEIGVTAQAVSEHLGDLVEEGYVDREARGRYEVTKEGVDWLISETDALSEYVTHVSEDVIGDVEVDTAIAAASISEGDRVRLSMADGVLTATPTDGSGSESSETESEPADGATALAVTDAESGRDVGVTDFEGVVDYDLGTVTAVEVPSIRAGGSSAVDAEHVRELAAETDLVAVAGTEALAAARTADLTPDLRFGTESAVEEAAAKGLDVLLLASSQSLSAHADRLRDSAVGYAVEDATAR